MNLLQSVVCFLAVVANSEPTTRNESPAAKADLGQREAALEKSGKEHMGHMEVTKPKNRLTENNEPNYRDYAVVAPLLYGTSARPMEL